MLMRYSGGGVGHTFQVPTAPSTLPRTMPDLEAGGPPSSDAEEVGMEDIVERDVEDENMDGVEGELDVDGREEVEFIGDAEDPTLNEENSGDDYEADEDDDYEADEDDDDLDEDVRMGFRF